MTIDQNFQNILKAVINNGEKKINQRRNTHRLEIPSYTFRHEAKDGFPLVSLKSTPFKNIVTELIWFLNGDNTKQFLNKYGNKIWDKDIANWNGKDAGQNYSKQWRDYSGQVDQIQYVIDMMKKDIHGSRIKLESWNPSEINKTALPPCHTGFQIVSSKGGFELHWQQRSSDLFLGISYNIASYWLLGLFLQEVTGYELKAIQGDLKCVHLYENAILEGIVLANKELKEYDKPVVTFEVTEDLKNIDPDKVFIRNYYPDKFVKVEMLAPIKP